MIGFIFCLLKQFLFFNFINWLSWKATGALQIKFQCYLLHVQDTPKKILNPATSQVFTGFQIIYFSHKHLDRHLLLYLVGNKILKSNLLPQTSMKIRNIPNNSWG